jgi:4-hydroxybenzoyl-CoA reductase subunit beta
MSEPLPPFELMRPTTVDEVIACRARHPGSRILAGGTDLIVAMRRGLLEPNALVDVTGVEALRALRGTSRPEHRRRRDAGSACR